MSNNDGIIELLSEALERRGAFKARRMFGGHGLYLDGQFFAILDDGVLYFKVSDTTRPRYAAEGMGPFTYRTKSGEHALGSYWSVPERLLDEPDELLSWAVEAVRVARAAKAPPRAKAGPTGRKRTSKR